jgi:hypothetical protein
MTGIRLHGGPDGGRLQVPHEDHDAMVTSDEHPGDGAAAQAGTPARRRWRPSLKLIIVLLLVAGLAVAMIVGGKEAVHWLQSVAEKSRTPGMLAVLCTIYAFLLAIPGVPGLEVGLVMMGVFQETGIIAAWLCTVAGLNMAFFAGRKLPRDRIEQWLKPKNVAEGDLPDFAIGKSDTMTLVLERNRVGRAVLRWTGPPGGWRRYVLVAFLFNMPGNFIIGGGGGIALFCGTSQDLKWPWYLVTTVLAAAVIPLMFYGGLLTARQIIPG